MRIRKTCNVVAPLSAALAVPYAHAHPGHEHASGLVAGLGHWVTEWAPLLALLVLMAAAGYWLWRARAR